MANTVVTLNGPTREAIITESVGSRHDAWGNEVGARFRREMWTVRQALREDAIQGDRVKILIARVGDLEGVRLNAVESVEAATRSSIPRLSTSCGATSSHGVQR